MSFIFFRVVFGTGFVVVGVAVVMLVLDEVALLGGFFLNNGFTTRFGFGSTAIVMFSLSVSSVTGLMTGFFVVVFTVEDCPLRRIQVDKPLFVVGLPYLKKFNFLVVASNSRASSSTGIAIPACEFSKSIWGLDLIFCWYLGGVLTSKRSTDVAFTRSCFVSFFMVSPSCGGDLKLNQRRMIKKRNIIHI